ncbi:hypothetical protein [Bradyrhizobium sp. AUGA SZCCT0182]|uniref:hypothetical protein n=1 Tax=Bradyrhizobium sp. AUGA SZCCT0182 TaxID=2807667 RepID=UPI001BA9F13F|nr:hypothetical protein [Bradyrhizobium sp. AUGA SZCCT0182]MBR1236875.1 hypothetical protein [Bradyrhizobium sp. AUGA SZCCT0182]
MITRIVLGVLVAIASTSTLRSEVVTASRNGEPPSDLIALGSNTLAVVDHVNAKIFFVTPSGDELGQRSFPRDFRVDRHLYLNDQVLLSDTATTRALSIKRGDVQAASLPDIKVLPTHPQDVRQRAIRRTHRRIGIQVPNLAKELDVRAVTSGYLASALYLGQDEKGRSYTLARELQLATTQDMADGKTVLYDGKPITRNTIKITVMVGRHDAEGQRTEVAKIPINVAYKLAFGRYVAVAPDGKVYAMLLKSSGLGLLEAKFTKETQQKKNRKPIAAGAATAAAADLLAAAIPIVSLRSLAELSADSADEKDTPGQEADSGRAVNTTIAAMKKEATKWLKFSWTPQASNLADGNFENCKSNINAPFELPHQFKVAVVGTPIPYVPYNWGGKVSLNQIKHELERGYRAGNICSKADDASPNTTGIDCSGFVGQVWGVSSFGTSNAHRRSLSLPGINKMRWGDVFNRSGKHIRMYVGEDTERRDEEGLRFRSIESASMCGGVCERSHNIEQYNGYEIRRRK